MLSQISSFFSGLKSGKSKKRDKKPNWYDNDPNGSADYDDDDIDPPYFGCLGRTGSSDWNSQSRQRRNSRASSTQSLDKLGKQKNKDSGVIRGATSMLDLNSNKKNKISSSKAQPNKTEPAKNYNFAASKDLLKSGIKSQRLGFGKLAKEKTPDQKEKKQNQKSDKLKRGYSWRQAYRQGVITIENSSNALPRVNTEERFIIDKSSRSSSSSSQNTSNETRQARLNAAPNRYSSTIHLIAIPTDPSENESIHDTNIVGSVLNVNDNLRNDKTDSRNTGRTKENIKYNDVSKSRIGVFRTSSQSNPTPPHSTETNTFQQPSFTTPTSSAQSRANDKSVIYPSHHNLPPPPPPPIQQHNQKTNQFNDTTSFSALLRKVHSTPDQAQESPNKPYTNNGYQSKLSKNGVIKSTFNAGLDTDLTDSPNNCEKPTNKVMFNEYQPIRESNYTPTNPAYPRKGSLKVEDLVQHMNQFEFPKFSQGVASSTPIFSSSHKQLQLEEAQQDYSNKRYKENMRTPVIPPNQAYTGKISSKTQANNQQLFRNKKNNDGDKNSSKKLEYDNELRICDTKSGAVYIKGKLLGKGGFAKCYEMTDLKNQTIYAGKIISKHNLAKKNQTEKILREVELHFSLNHKNVVSFHSFFEDPSNVYIMLELCSRKSLVHILKKRKSFTEPEVRFYMKHLTNGVQYIHSQRIIHRDLKLGNMLLDSNMQLKIADFGLATRMEYDGERKMTVCGTPNYIAPEVLQKSGHSYEADIWAMGCIMYALLCGRPPFETSTLKETYSRIVTNRYILPQHVSMSAKNLIKHLIVSEPYLRPSLDRIAMDNFFQDGYMPEELSPTTCESPPKFPLASLNINNEANKKAGKTKPNQTDVNNVGNMAQSKNSRKSASQIITRAKPSEFETATNSNLKDEYSVGSAPSIPRNLDSSFKNNAQPISPARLYHNLMSQLEVLIPRKGEPVPNGAVGSSVHPGSNSKWSRGAGVCVTKWVDYSNKYGFGFQLSNGRVGILFNDGTKMLLSEDSLTAQMESAEGEKNVFSIRSIPDELQKKTTLLIYFSQFMENHLIPGGSMQTTPSRSSAVVTSTKEQGQGTILPAPVFLKKWFRTDKAVVMYLTDGTMQVNFFEDHTKVILNFEDSQQDNVYVTLVDSNRQASTYPLKSLPSLGCTPDVVDRLQYAATMIERVAIEEGEGSFIPRNI